MKYSFVSIPPVKNDIEEAVNFYKNISPELAHKFLGRIKEAKKLLEQQPKVFQLRYKDVRIKMLEQFPFNIHYLIDEERKRIVILAIVHAYRKPHNYLKRSE